ncbi:hypothetical protein EV421DRAFT_1740734 [Armillaria borealis]|uniref:Uncharacterized protein n=1 Tax=Armillaria borealis TaxID=47425 RepID=A0AA39J4K5_9AGAR|nr:hypothetical protein EV421DRAFT_1740734 [Armillaria borealis]
MVSGVMFLRVPVADDMRGVGFVGRTVVDDRGDKGGWSTGRKGEGWTEAGSTKSTAGEAVHESPSVLRTSGSLRDTAALEDGSREEGTEGMLGSDESNKSSFKMGSDEPGDDKSRAVASKSAGVTVNCIVVVDSTVELDGDRWFKTDNCPVESQAERTMKALVLSGCNDEVLFSVTVEEPLKCHVERRDLSDQTVPGEGVVSEVQNCDGLRYDDEDGLGDRGRPGRAVQHGVIGIRMRSLNAGIDESLFGVVGVGEVGVIGVRTSGLIVGINDIAVRVGEARSQQCEGAWFECGHQREYRWPEACRVSTVLQAQVAAAPTLRWDVIQTIYAQSIKVRSLAFYDLARYVLRPVKGKGEENGTPRISMMVVLVEGLA